MAFHGQTSLSSPEQPCCLRHDDYTVAIICPMGDELSPVLALLDESHETLGTSRDQNAYKLGKMGHHNVVVASMPEIGNNAAAMVVTQLLNDFSQIRFGLLVGIAGGIPDEDYDGDELNDIRLGDVVVSHSHGAYGGVIQFDRGKSTMDGFVVTGHHSKPPHVLAANVEILKATHNLYGNNISRYLDEMLKMYPGMKEKYSLPGSERDCIFEAGYAHEGGKTCKECDISRTIKRKQRRTESPRIHYGTIGSSNTVIKDSKKRDALRDMGILCIEMEAAGLMAAFPCLVIRGISDYADSHKNKKWQPYAAATAAAYTKELLSQIPQGEVQRIQSIVNTLEGLNMKVDWVVQRTRILVSQTQSTAEMTILEWLSSNDVKFSSLQNESQQTHTAGTGQWLLDHESYQNWRDHEPGLFWLHGVAGCGKTILCSTIIRDLQQNFSHSAYWYFRFDNQISQDVSQMLRSIIRQLSLSPLPEETRSLYDRHGQRGSEPSLEELITALSCTIESLVHGVYIVVDALDECPHKDKEGQRDRLLYCIKNLLEAHPSLHLLVTSRPEPDIEKDFRTVATCDLDIEQPIQKDVERFVKVTLEDPRLASWTGDVRDQIIAKLLEYEERRFRWADLQIKRFAQCPNIEQLRKAMNSVPKDLEAAYRQAFDAIDDENTTHVTKIMMWLTAALEPLTADQIAAIAGFRDSDYVLRICSTLLVTIIDEDTTRIIKLAHFSVKEFLVLKLYENSTQWYRFTMEHANKSVALFAIQGLLCPRHQLDAIVPYFARYWPRHALEGLRIDNQMELEEQICFLFSNKCRAQFHGWLKIHNPDDINGYQSYRAAEPLYYASLLGFQGVVSKIWIDDSQLSSNEGRYGNALNAAAISGNITVVKWLLQNCKGSAGFLDLVRVAREINANAMECIIEICNGQADVAITGDVVRAAAENESNGQQVIKALLENRGHEIQITEDIVSAAAGNWESGQQVVELLLKQRKDEVQVTIEVVRAAFANKYSGRHVLKVILENVESEAQITENVIKTAIENGESGQQVMELLLEKSNSANDVRITESIASLIIGNFDAPAARMLLEKKGDEVPMTEMVIEAAAENHWYGPQVMEVLLNARGDTLLLTEGVVMAAAVNSTSGRQVLEVLLKTTATKSQVTCSIASLIAERFDTNAMELLLKEISADQQLTKGIITGAVSNESDGQRVLEVLLGKEWKHNYHITEQVARSAARNMKCGQRMMELLLSNSAQGVQITDEVVRIILCCWNGARLMKLLSKSIKGYNSLQVGLRNASYLGNISAVQALLNRGAYSYDGLWSAIFHGNLKMTELFLEHGTRSRYDWWNDAFHVAIERGHIGIIELLLEQGAKQTASYRTGRTPLMYASQYGSADIAKLLITHGADLTTEDKDGRTALSIASICGRLQVVDTLLRGGADQSDKDYAGWTPLMFAAECGSTNIATLHLTYGAQHRLSYLVKDRALDLADCYRYVEVVDLLLQWGANPQVLNSNGQTPLMLASNRGHTNIAELLIRNDAGLEFVDNRGMTALNSAASIGHLEVVSLLVKHGADLEVADTLGYTALHNASGKEHLEVAQLLIENGADLALQSRRGWTALHCASSTGNIRMMEMLLQSGANFATTNNYGITPLHHACALGRVEAVRFLIEDGADIGFADNIGWTPLHVASWRGHTEIVEILSSMDSYSLTLHDSFGLTALEVAAKMGHDEIVSLLGEKTTEATSVKVSRAVKRFKGFWSRS